MQICKPTVYMPEHDNQHFSERHENWPAPVTPNQRNCHTTLHVWSLHFWYYQVWNVHQTGNNNTQNLCVISGQSQDARDDVVWDNFQSNMHRCHSSRHYFLSQLAYWHGAKDIAWTCYVEVLLMCINNITLSPFLMAFRSKIETTAPHHFTWLISLAYSLVLLTCCLLLALAWIPWDFWIEDLAWIECEEWVFTSRLYPRILIMTVVSEDDKDI